MFGKRVDTAIGLFHEASEKGSSHGVFFIESNDELIRFCTEFGLPGINESSSVSDSTETFDMTFIEEIAAFDNFFNSLLVGDGFPSILTTFANAF